MRTILDHLGLDVKDFERSRAFYEQALAPLGITLPMQPAPEVAGFVLDPDGNNVEGVCHHPA